MSSFVAFESRRISLAERSRSNFAFVSIFFVQVRIFLLSAMPMRVASGKFRPTRAGFCTGTRMHRLVDEGHSLLG
jgi:hypothetical protein